MECSQMPLKLFWHYSIWRDYVHARCIQKILTKKVTTHFLAHPFGKKKNMVECFDFFSWVFSNFLIFLEHICECILGLHLCLNWSFFKNFFDKEMHNSLSLSLYIYIYIINMLRRHHGYLWLFPPHVSIVNLSW